MLAMSLTATREKTPEGIRAANALRILRELRGYSRPAFSRLLEPDLSLSPSAIARIEKGQRHFPFEDVPIFARVLDVPKAAFLAPLHPAYRSGGIPAQSEYGLPHRLAI